MMVNGTFRVGEFLIEPQLNTIARDDQSNRLEPKVMQVLQCLSNTAGEVVSKEQLMRAVWTDTIVTDDVLTRAVSELRKAFRDDSKEPRYIQTIPKRGYRLIAQVSYDSIEPDTSSEHSQIRSGNPQTRSWPIRLSWLAVILLVSSGAAWIYISRGPKGTPRPTMRVVPFTSFPGREDQAALSPDGNQIAFVWDGEKGDNTDIYVKSINGDRPLRITSDPGIDLRPTWSPDAQRIAFVRFTPSDYRFGVFVASALGQAPERMLFSLNNELATLSWSPDGKFIATAESSAKKKPSHIVLFSPETGEKRNLTTPPDQYWADSTPAFSPDSKFVAFVRENTPITGDIYVVPITGGEPRRVTYDNARHTFSNAIVGGVAWTADGKEIVFSSTRGGTPSLWRVGISGGEPERLAVGGDNTFYPSISLRGNRLAYTQMSGGTPIYRIEVPTATGQHVQPVKLLASTREDAAPRYSADGKKIAFQSDRSGNLEIWICDSEGQNLTQLTFFGKGQAGTPQWSPDGNQIAFDYRAQDRADVYVVNVAGGVPRRMTTETSDDCVPSWSIDGKYIYFASDRGGEQQVWKMPAEGGQAIQVTRQGGFVAFGSADGKYLYYCKGFGPGIWRVPVEGGQEVPILPNQPSVGCWGQWELADDGIYFIKIQWQIPSSVDFFRFSTAQVTSVVGLGKVNDFVSGFAVSPDHHEVLYAQRDPINSDIMLVENFR
jgi:Tol biopolymer transport system component/DNA-binding winged helix-turn-helix (wHTH) protein